MRRALGPSKDLFGVLGVLIDQRSEHCASSRTPMNNLFISQNSPYGISTIFAHGSTPSQSSQGEQYYYLKWRE